jgi:predicted TPR repeat methyltransferase
LARLGVGENTPAMTAAYVRRLFDQQAASFDEALLQRLDYRGPEVVLDAVRSVAGMELRIGSMLDLGCGTGLGGAAFRPYADWLVGVDISPGMVAKTREKGFYDRLAVLDLQHFLHAEVQSRAQYHLVVAADVFVYVSDLVPITAAAARVLTPDGLFAFTVEVQSGDGVVLQQTFRYAHGAPHVRTAIADAGLNLVALNHVVTRKEKGVPVPSLVVVASNSGPERSVPAVESDP